MIRQSKEYESAIVWMQDAVRADLLAKYEVIIFKSSTREVMMRLEKFIRLPQITPDRFSFNLQIN